MTVTGVVRHVMWSHLGLDDDEPSQCDGVTGDGYVLGTEECDDVVEPVRGQSR